ncbi:unnamed protein product [Urochloa humidicola]
MPSPSSRRRRRRRDSRYRRRLAPRTNASHPRAGPRSISSPPPPHHRRIRSAVSDLDGRRISAAVLAVSDRINCELAPPSPNKGL